MVEATIEGIELDEENDQIVLSLDIENLDDGDNLDNDDFLVIDYEGLSREKYMELRPAEGEYVGTSETTWWTQTSSETVRLENPGEYQGGSLPLDELYAVSIRVRSGGLDSEVLDEATMATGNVPLVIHDLSHKGEDPPQECEVRVEVKEQNKWVRIPVTLCELWANKDGPADITRTAKVKFPSQWDGNNIRQYVNGFKDPNESDGGTPYDEARVWFYDHETDTYQIAHYGYVGGVGPASETGVDKFWVYDPADLMKGIQVSKSFGEPTIAQILEFVERGEDNSGEGVGLEHRSVFSDIKTYIAGLQEVKLQKEDTSDLGGEANDGNDFVIKEDLPVVGAFELNATDLIDDVFDYMFGSEVTNPMWPFGGQKRFQRNRNNLVDVIEWFAGEVGGRWHFEPTPDGPVLFFDNTSAVREDNKIWNDENDTESEWFESDEDGDFSRRLFIDNRLALADNEGNITPEQASNIDGDAGYAGDISDYTDRAAFTDVDVLDNNALYDIKPFNTLYLNGESATNEQRYSGTGVGINLAQSAAPGMFTEFYPHVKVVYEPLLDRAGGYEYAPEAIESDKVTLASAARDAKKEFRKHLEEETEGTLTIKGEPYILPYDYIRTAPQCNDFYENVDSVPITYEVNSVKHSRSAGERYTTELGVSLVFDEEKLTYETEYKQA